MTHNLYTSRLTFLKMANLSNWPIGSTQSLPKSQKVCFLGVVGRNWQVIPKIIWKCKAPRRVKTALEKKKNKVKRLILPRFKTYHKTIVLKTMWYWHKKRLTDLWNTLESSEINPYVYSQLTFDNSAKIVQYGKESLSNKCCWDNWPSTCKKINLCSYNIHKN